MEQSACISLINLLPEPKKNWGSLRAARFLDRLLAIDKIHQLYSSNNQKGLRKLAFTEDFLKNFQVSLNALGQWTNSIPDEGPVLFAANHPFGGIEGLALAQLLGSHRPDLKILANQGLKIFDPIKDFFIFIDPINDKNPKNMGALRECIKHLDAGKALLIFPAGRVSYFQKEKGRVSEHPWNRIIGRLTATKKTLFFPLFIPGQNSERFYKLGRIYSRLRLAMLPRELLNKKGLDFQVAAGHPLAQSDFPGALEMKEQAQLCRALSYAQDPSWKIRWPDENGPALETLEPSFLGDRVAKELSLLPSHQRLLDYKNFSVFYGYQHQLPITVTDIGFQRELTFRSLKEGSGRLSDTDPFDATYTHLILFDNDAKTIAGAYRFGQTDQILQSQGTKGLYLSRMFHFGDDFCNRKEPCLEMGRSFLAPNYQRSYQGLHLLWRGIGEFLVKHPQYRSLYGTVSLSRLYDPRSVSLMARAFLGSEPVNRALKPKHGAFPRAELKPFQQKTLETQISELQNSDKAVARTPFHQWVHPEIEDFAKTYDLRKHVETFVKSIEPDGKGLPVLLKHYAGLGAQFHAMGVDHEFRATPGLLLSVSVSDIPGIKLKRYMGKQMEAYRAYSSAATLDGK